MEPREEKHNEQLMKLIKAMHQIVGSDDIEKNRASQEQMAKRLGTVKDMQYT